jgi:hypothetical protein
MGSEDLISASRRDSSIAVRGAMPVGDARSGVALEPMPEPDQLAGGKQAVSADAAA